MTSGNGTRRWRWLGLVVAVALLPGLALAREQAAKEPAPTPETVEMFTAIEDGRIDVKLIAKDSTECRVLIENKTDKPLSVKLPGAFAAVPVLAQMGMGGMGGMGMGGGGRGMGGMGGGMGGSQGMGGGFGGGMGMGGMGGGMGGMGMGGMGGGMFNVPPEKVGKLKVTTVCLEHGKREPRPAVQYEIRPIEDLTDRVEVHEVCRMLANGMMSQRVAQVAAWHLNNDMSFQELAAKELQFANGMKRPYFAPQEIQAAMQVVATASQLAKQRESDSQQGSLSQR